MVQTQDKFFEFPIAFDVVVDGKTTRHIVWAAKKKENVFEFDAAKKPEVVIPNADQDLLCDINDNKSMEEIAAQYKYGKDEFTTRLLALQTLANSQSTNDLALNTLISALKDPYEGIRERAIGLLDGKDAKVKSKATAELKRVATSDPKTKVQSAALRKLNEMGDTDLAMFSNALKSKSYSVQSAGAAGVLRLDPSKINELASLDNEVLATNPALIAELMDTWISKNDKSKLALSAEHVAFFLFTQYEDAAMGAKLQKGFGWVLGSDDMESTQKVITAYKQVHQYYAKDNPSLTVMLKNLLDQAISLKVKANQSAPSKSLEAQIEALNKAKDSMK